MFSGKNFLDEKYTSDGKNLLLLPNRIVGVYSVGSIDSPGAKKKDSEPRINLDHSVCTKSEVQDSWTVLRVELATDREHRLTGRTTIT